VKWASPFCVMRGSDTRHCLSLFLVPGNPDWFGFTFLVSAHPGSPGQNSERCKAVVVVVLVVVVVVVVVVVER